jgi:hypothetical protein
MSQQENGGAARPEDQDSADRQLIEDCLAGKEVAWKQLNQRILQRINDQAFNRWPRDAGNPNLFDELAVDLLESLFLCRGLLLAHLRFGRNLNGYLDLLINRAVKNHYRNVARQRRLLMRFCAARLAELSTAAEPPGLMQQLLEILTPADKNHLRWIAESAGHFARPCPYEPAYARQLEHRIALKVHSLLTRG